MKKFRKPFGRSAADALRRTFRSDEFRVPLFELTQLVDYFVVLAIGNFGIVLKIVEIFVALNFFTQILDRFFDRWFLWQGWSLMWHRLQSVISGIGHHRLKSVPLLLKKQILWSSGVAIKSTTDETFAQQSQELLAHTQLLALGGIRIGLQKRRKIRGNLDRFLRRAQGELTAGSERFDARRTQMPTRKQPIAVHAAGPGIFFHRVCDIVGAIKIYGVVTDDYAQPI